MSDNLVMPKYVDTLKKNELKTYNAIISLLDASYADNHIKTKEVEINAVQRLTGATTPTIKRHIKAIKDKGLLLDVVIIDYTAKYVLDLFRDLYRKAYNMDYEPTNYVGDITQLSRLVKKYERKELESLLQYAVLSYRVKFANEAYPMPTVGIMCSWCLERAKQAKERDAKQVPVPKTMPTTTKITVSRGAELDLDFI